MSATVVHSLIISQLTHEPFPDHFLLQNELRVLIFIEKLDLKVAQLIKSLSCRHKDLNLIPIIYAKRQVWWRTPIITTLGRQEQVDFRGRWPSSLAYLVSSGSTGSRQHCRGTSSCPLASRAPHSHKKTCLFVVCLKKQEILTPYNDSSNIKIERISFVLYTT